MRGGSGVEEDRLYKGEMEPIREVRLHEDVERISLKTRYAFFVVLLFGSYPSTYHNTLRISLLVFSLCVGGSVFAYASWRSGGMGPSKTTAKKRGHQPIFLRMRRKEGRERDTGGKG